MMTLGLQTLSSNFVYTALQPQWFLMQSGKGAARRP
jgi:hypothetical protein